jgi:hypothetical protein
VKLREETKLLRPLHYERTGKIKSLRCHLCKMSKALESRVVHLSGDLHSMEQSHLGVPKTAVHCNHQ